MKHLYFYIIIFSCITTFSQEINIETFATGFTNPVNIKNAGDARLFVVEQAGIIKVLNADGSVNATPFLDINDRVSNSGGERGLLGLAFHPDYVNTGYFYVNYIDNSGNTVISRFSRSTTDENSADSNSELQLLTYIQPFSNHNGGNIAFGPDGYLYIASGDGGSGGDPGDRAQSLSTLLGKLLRIDVDNTSNGNNYAIPSDNPFVSSSNAMPEIWAYGLRNPWKFSFDKDTNDLWIADVGQGTIEEIDMVSSTAAGINYGWRCYEGTSVYDQSGNCPADNSLTIPIAQYSHNNDGLFKCSITGGYRYRGAAYPNFTGLYFFADYCSNEIGFLKQNGADWTITYSSPFNGNGWTTFGEDVNGELYIAGNDSDTVYKIVDATLGINTYGYFDVNLFPNPAGDQISLQSMDATKVISVVNISDLQGKMIYSSQVYGQDLITISTKNLTSGLYLVEIIDSKGNKLIKKLIKS